MKFKLRITSFRPVLKKRNTRCLTFRKNPTSPKIAKVSQKTPKMNFSTSKKYKAKKQLKAKVAYQ